MALSGNYLSQNKGEKIDKAVNDIDTHIMNKENPHEVTASQAGAISNGEKAAALGVATLDENAKLVSSQVPDLSAQITTIVTAQLAPILARLEILENK